MSDLPNQEISANAGYTPSFPQGLPQAGHEENKEPHEQVSLSSVISDLDRRLRTLEERYGNLRKKVQLSDQNLIESERSFIKEIRTVNDELMDLKRTMNDFSEKILIFHDELNKSAKKQDVKVIEKYLLLWSPQQFVTRNELKEYLKTHTLKMSSEGNSDKENETEEE
ncbi:MAG: hypothetical protein WC916_03260 [Candidatus Woesearchaeota archaeon]